MDTFRYERFQREDQVPAPGDAALINGHLVTKYSPAPTTRPAPGDAALINGHRLFDTRFVQKINPHRATPP